MKKVLGSLLILILGIFTFSLSSPTSVLACGPGEVECNCQYAGGSYRCLGPGSSCSCPGGGGTANDPNHQNPSPPPSSGGGGSSGGSGGSTGGVPNGPSSGCCGSNSDCVSWYGANSSCSNSNGACASGKQCRGGSGNGGTCTQTCTAGMACGTQICNGQITCNGSCYGGCGNGICESNGNETATSCPADCRPAATTAPVLKAYCKAGYQFCSGLNGGRPDGCYMSNDCSCTDIKTYQVKNLSIGGTVQCGAKVVDPTAIFYATPSNPVIITPGNYFICTPDGHCTLSSNSFYNGQTMTIYRCNGPLPANGICLDVVAETITVQAGQTFDLGSYLNGCGSLQADIGNTGANGAVTIDTGTSCSTSQAGGGSTNPSTPPGSNPPGSNPPSTPAPICLSVTSDNASPKLGDSVRFTCGTVTGVTKYEFRYKVGDGAYQALATTTASSNVTVPLAVNSAGTYKVQCRICVGTNCSAYDTN